MVLLALLTCSRYIHPRGKDPRPTRPFRESIGEWKSARDQALQWEELSDGNRAEWRRGYSASMEGG